MLEFSRTTTRIVKILQHQRLCNEIFVLNHSQSFKSLSKILPFTPFLDPNCNLSVAVMLRKTKKYSMSIPKSKHITVLIIIYLDAGTQLILAKLIFEENSEF